MHFLLSILLAMGPSTYFYGWEVVQYVWYFLDAYVEQFPWQVHISFVIIGLCIFTIFNVFIFFVHRLLVRGQSDRLYLEYRRRFARRFRDVMRLQEKVSHEEIEYICRVDRTEFWEYDSKTLTRLVLSVRRGMGTKVYIPNLQRLCNITGVQRYLENNLVKGVEVEQTLQTLITLPIRVSEGALASYTSNKDARIRELARAYFGFCSKTEPFSLVAQDVNEPFNLWYPIIFHRLCGWQQAQRKPLPHFISLVEHSDFDDKRAIFIAEVPYYGTEEEKHCLPQYLTTANPKCCIAAIRALAQIGDPTAEQYLIDHYDILFPPAKREVLQAVAKINTGRSVDFFCHAYLHSTSHKTRAVALSCLLGYGEQGRQAFYELRNAGIDDNKFFEQIITNTI